MCCRSLTITEWGNSDVTGVDSLRNKWCSRKRPLYCVRARGKSRTYAGWWCGNQLSFGLWRPLGTAFWRPEVGGGLQAYFLSLHCHLPPSSVSPALGGCCLELLLFSRLFPGTITLAFSPPEPDPHQAGRGALFIVVHTVFATPHSLMNKLLLCVQMSSSS